MARPLVVGRLFLDSGTQSFATGVVNHPSWVYEGRVLNWGIIDRSIPTPSGLPQVGDAKIRLVDTDRKWRNIFAKETARRRFMEIKVLAEGASEAATPHLYRGQVISVSFGPGFVEVTIRDITFAWLDEQIPGFINKTNYPFLAKETESAFLPIINGHCVSPDINPQGVIPLPHIGFDSVIGDRWGLAAHPVWDVVAIYRKLPDEGVFSIVDDSEYNVTTETRSFFEVPDIEFNPTYIDFLVEQPEGTEVRADVDGIFERGTWEGIPQDLTFEGNRNPMNFFINMIFLIMHKAGTTASIFYVPSIQDLLTRFATIIPDSAGSSGTAPFLCDGALTEFLTVREFLARFLASFQIDFFQRKDGRLAVAYIDETDPARPVFTEGRHILRESFYEDIADPTVNQARYMYERNYATGEWIAQEIYDNTDDQNTLGEIQEDSSGIILDSTGQPVVTPRIETDVFELWFVRDPLTALFVTLRRMSFLALGSFRQQWEMPLPETIDDVELAALVGITHYAGADLFAGYTNKEVKITAITIDLDNFKMTVKSIVRVPQAISMPQVVPFTAAATVFAGDLEMMSTGAVDFEETVLNSSPKVETGEDAMEYSE